MEIQKAIDELVDYAGDVHKQTISHETVTMARQALEYQSKAIKEIIRDFTDKLIVELNKEKKLNPCRNTSCNDCPYTKKCHEGEQASKVVIDNVVNVVNKLAEEFIKEGE